MENKEMIERLNNLLEISNKNFMHYVGEAERLTNELIDLTSKREELEERPHNIMSVSSSLRQAKEQVNYYQEQITEIVEEKKKYK